MDKNLPHPISWHVEMLGSGIVMWQICCRTFVSSSVGGVRSRCSCSGVCYMLYSIYNLLWACPLVVSVAGVCSLCPCSDVWALQLISFWLILAASSYIIKNTGKIAFTGGYLEHYILGYVTKGITGNAMMVWCSCKVNRWKQVTLVAA